MHPLGNRSLFSGAPSTSGRTASGLPQRPRCPGSSVRAWQSGGAPPLEQHPRQARVPPPPLPPQQQGSSLAPRRQRGAALHASSAADLAAAIASEHQEVEAQEDLQQGQLGQQPAAGSVAGSAAVLELHPRRQGLARAWAALDAFHRFTRPHTMLGTAVSVTSVSLLALGPGGVEPAALAAYGLAISSALLMNICIVGINQIYDIEIDRVNKPYLPLAAGLFSVGTGVGIVLATGALSLLIGAASGSLPLLCTLGGSLLLGIAYSTDLPLLRWKRYPIAAAACILAVRAVLVQLGFYFHMRSALGSTALEVTRPIAFATAFMLVFSVVIALFKDVPDVAGDAKAGVQTLSVRLGPRRVYWACIALLELAYAGAVAVGLCSPLLWSKAATVGVHAALGLLLFLRARQTDLDSSASMYACYMDVWKLFYLEYALLPLMR